MVSKFTKNIFCIGLGTLLSALILSACVGPEEIPKPKNLIPEDKYIDLMVEIQHIITYRNANVDSSIDVDSLKLVVYENYDVTEEQYAASHQYYQRHVEQQVKRIGEALERLQAEEKYIQAHIDSALEANALQDSLMQADTTLDKQQKLNPKSMKKN